MVLLVLGLLSKIILIGWIAGILGFIGWLLNLFDAYTSENEESLL